MATLYYRSTGEAGAADDFAKFCKRYLHQTYPGVRISFQNRGDMPKTIKAEMPDDTIFLKHVIETALDVYSRQKPTIARDLKLEYLQDAGKGKNGNGAQAESPEHQQLMRELKKAKADTETALAAAETEEKKRTEMQREKETLERRVHELEANGRDTPQIPREICDAYKELKHAYASLHEQKDGTTLEEYAAKQAKDQQQHEQIRQTIGTQWYVIPTSQEMEFLETYEMGRAEREQKMAEFERLTQTIQRAKRAMEKYALLMIVRETDETATAKIAASGDSELEKDIRAAADTAFRHGQEQQAHIIYEIEGDAREALQKFRETFSKLSGIPLQIEARHIKNKLIRI